MNTIVNGKVNYIHFDPTKEQLRDKYNGLLFMMAGLMLETKSYDDVEMMLVLTAPCYLGDESVAELRDALNHMHKINKEIKKREAAA